MVEKSVLLKKPEKVEIDISNIVPRRRVDEFNAANGPQDEKSKAASKNAVALYRGNERGPGGMILYCGEIPVARVKVWFRGGSSEWHEGKKEMDLVFDRAIDPPQQNYCGAIRSISLPGKPFLSYFLVQLLDASGNVLFDSGDTLIVSDRIFKMPLVDGKRPAEGYKKFDKFDLEYEVSPDSKFITFKYDLDMGRIYPELSVRVMKLYIDGDSMIYYSSGDCLFNSGRGEGTAKEKGEFTVPFFKGKHTYELEVFTPILTTLHSGFPGNHEIQGKESRYFTISNGDEPSSYMRAMQIDLAFPAPGAQQTAAGSTGGDNQGEAGNLQTPSQAAASQPSEIATTASYKVVSNNFFSLDEAKPILIVLERIGGQEDGKDTVSYFLHIDQLTRVGRTGDGKLSPDTYDYDLRLGKTITDDQLQMLLNTEVPGKPGVKYLSPAQLNGNKE
ncbi:MAG: hypothetical protein WC717_02005 [Candidatus Micrarchaeia archaeon]|jgi:hypothetical protein